VTYKYVFVVGLIGSYFGGVISVASRCPFMLLNDEFPSIYPATFRSDSDNWHIRGVWCSDNAFSFWKGRLFRLASRLYLG
jgi:hypothetical protein